MKTTSGLRILGITLLLLGMLLASLVNILLSTPNMEASYYFYVQKRLPHEKLSTLKCPKLLGKNQSADFSVMLQNNTDKPMKNKIRMYFARPMNDFFEEVRVDIPAGQSETYIWIATPEDISFNRMILADFFVTRSFNEPSRHASCGVTVLPINGNGNVLLVVGVVLAMAFIGLGAWMWLYSIQDKKLLKPSVVIGVFLLAAITLLGMFLSLFGAWNFGIVLIALTLLFGVIMSAYVLQGL